ncbi:MAG: hypothetical protein PHE27_01130 [Alphaproteobacteria bacterium]|nr:hypothetical protein [Alphaproteobacteria bacterium]
MYVLSKEEIENGHLSQEGVHSHTGGVYKIGIFNSADFKHHEELMRYSKLESDEKIEERGSQIFKRIQDEGLIGEGFREETAKNYSMQAANRPNECIGAGKNTCILAEKNRALCVNFDTIRERGYTGAHDPKSPIWYYFLFEKMPRLIVGVLSEDEIDKSPVSIRVMQNGFMIVHDTEPVVKLLARNTGISEALIDPKEDDGLFLLFNELHEMEHWDQLQLINKDFQRVLDYYNEMDADWAAGEALAKAGVGALTCEHRRQARFAGMLSSSSEYHFQAVMDDMKARKTPKDYYENFLAVQEIHWRLGMHRLGVKPEDFTSQDVRDAVSNYFNLPGRPEETQLSPNASIVKKNVGSIGMQFVWWSREAFVEINNPAAMFTTLRQMSDKGVFEGYTDTLAKKIVAAAEYFNSELTHDDDPEVHAHIQQRMEKAAAAEVSQPKSVSDDAGLQPARGQTPADSSQAKLFPAS